MLKMENMEFEEKIKWSNDRKHCQPVDNIYTVDYILKWDQNKMVFSKNKNKNKKSLPNWHLQSRQICSI